MDIPFIKMEGCGNDYIYLDLITGKGPAASSLGNLEDLARRISDRHYGVGSDGLILIRPSESGDARMQMFNADGSESEMCGNGIRCVARYLHDAGVTDGRPVRIETGAGLLTLFVRATGGVVTSVRVDMGVPELERSRIPMSGPAGQVLNEPLKVGGFELEVTAVSMGNPHCVLFVPNIALAPVADLGPMIENHPAFPNRTNVEFVEIVSRTEVRQRTWERGSGETLACGTGASAVCVAGAVGNRTERQVLIHLKGGDLRLEWAGDNHVFMEGPAREVFRGVWKS
jgi:diaminopimelate epimerase